MGHPLLAQFARQWVVAATGRDEQAVDIAVQQRVGGLFLLSGIVSGGGDDREVAASFGGPSDRLEHQRHHGVTEPGHQHADGRGRAAAQVGGERVAPVAQCGGDFADALGCCGLRRRHPIIEHPAGGGHAHPGRLGDLPQRDRLTVGRTLCWLRHHPLRLLVRSIMPSGGPGHMTAAA